MCVHLFPWKTRQYEYAVSYLGQGRGHLMTCLYSQCLEHNRTEWGNEFLHRLWDSFLTLHSLFWIRGLPKSCGTCAEWLWCLAWAHKGIWISLMSGPAVLGTGLSCLHFSNSSLQLKIPFPLSYILHSRFCLLSVTFNHSYCAGRISKSFVL